MRDSRPGQSGRLAAGAAMRTRFKTMRRRCDTQNAGRASFGNYADGFLTVKLSAGLAAALLLIFSSLSFAQQIEPPWSHRSVAWSPSGQSLVFSSYRQGAARIYTIRADGTHLQLLTDENSNNSTPSWSPNGKRLVFASRREARDFDIYAMRRDGSHLVQLTSDPGLDSLPAWSPDGRSIAFVSNRGTGRLQLFLMNADGTGQRRLLETDYSIYNPRWSPDGRRLVFYSEAGDHRDQIWTVDANGANLRRLSDGSGHYFLPSWSRDGSEIIFASPGANADDVRLRITPSSTWSPRPIGSVAGRTIFYASWSPRDERIAVIEALGPPVDGPRPTRIEIIRPGDAAPQVVHPSP